jgi:hypothetical protein
MCTIWAQRIIKIRVHSSKGFIVCIKWFNYNSWDRIFIEIAYKLLKWFKSRNHHKIILIYMFIYSFLFFSQAFNLFHIKNKFILCMLPFMYKMTFIFIYSYITTLIIIIIIFLPLCFLLMWGKRKIENH